MDAAAVAQAGVFAGGYVALAAEGDLRADIIPLEITAVRVDIAHRTATHDVVAARRAVGGREATLAIRRTTPHRAALGSDVDAALIPEGLAAIRQERAHRRTAVRFVAERRCVFLEARTVAAAATADRTAAAPSGQRRTGQVPAHGAALRQFRTHGRAARVVLAARGISVGLEATAATGAAPIRFLDHAKIVGQRSAVIVPTVGAAGWIE